MLVKDELDIVGYTIRHLLEQVDAVIVADNGSTDGTREYLYESFGEDERVWVKDDDDPAYWQSRKTTALAQDALAAGHSWVIPCDADEIWYSPDDRAIRDYLAGLAPDQHLVKAPLFNHIPTALDSNFKSPIKRIGWRKRERGVLPKVACRLHPSLVIEAGNHGARYDGAALAGSGLTIRHYSWRSPEQFLRKVKNGVAAYAATDLPEGIGEHWRMWEGVSDEAIIDHYHRWFHSERPADDDSLIFDPMPRT
jgi:glycosyltransferase involved in cell wall biosynthesis